VRGQTGNPMETQTREGFPRSAGFRYDITIPEPSLGRPCKTESPDCESVTPLGRNNTLAAESATAAAFQRL
jgi:hypothetical protein